MLNDLTFALRALRRQPGFAAAAILTLAVGVGATVAIFSTVNATLLRPLPFANPDDLFAMYTPATDGRFTTGRASGIEVARLNDPSVSVVHAAGTGRIDSTIIRADGTGVQALGYGVTDGFFDIFNASFVLGRPFNSKDHAPGTQGAAILSHRVWRDLFGSDPAIVGKLLQTTNGGPNGTPIIGVAARDFDMPKGADFWLSFSIGPNSTGHGFDGYLRVKPGTNQKRLESEMAGAMDGIARDYGMLGKNRRYDIKPLVAALVGDLRSTLLVVLAAAALLLLLASVNVTNLMLARGAVRSREMAVRVALGAGRGRIVRQLLTESLVMSSLGTMVGLALAFLGIRALVALGAAELPRLDRIPFDARVLMFTLATLVITTLLIGFAPALRLSNTSLKSLMNESGRGTTGGGAAARLLKMMTVAEIALAITLVAGAGWLVRSYANLGNANPGFVSEGRLVFDVTPPAQRLFPPDTRNVTREMLVEKVMAWTQDLTGRLRAIPGVSAVATTATMPFGTDRDSVLYIGAEGSAADPDHPLVARAHGVSEHFFETMGIKMVAGRRFNADDRLSTAPVAIVNKTFAKRYLGGRDPLTVKFAAGYPTVPTGPFLAIVGVVDDVKYVALAKEADPAYYVPESQSPFFGQAVVVNTSVADPAALGPSIRSAVLAMDPLLPVMPRALTDVVAQSISRQRLGMTLMLIFAGAALALAAVGIYGVVAYASSQRVGEVATRMALGATPSDAFWLLMKQGRTLAIAGTATGLAIAYVAGRAASSLFYEVRVTDPAILAIAAALVFVITVMSILIPARSVSRTEPSRVLRLD
jgi:predicted permease